MKKQGATEQPWPVVRRVVAGATRHLAGHRYQLMLECGHARTIRSLRWPVQRRAACGRCGAEGER